MILDNHGKLIPFERSQSMKRLFYLLGVTLVAGVLLVGVHALYFNYTVQQEQVFKEKVYRTQIEVWTGRMANNLQALARNNNTTNRLEGYAIQHEIHDTVPPARYEETHIHLTRAIDYYVDAVEAAKNNDARAIPLLKQYEYEMRQALNAYQ